MKAGGDIPADHRLLIEELETLEDWFVRNKHKVSSLKSAFGMTCMAADWYRIYMEEEGERLLIQAEKLHPGYFRSPIQDHLDKDLDFFYLVESIKSTPGLEVMRSFGFEG